MLKKDFADWEYSKEFPLKELRTHFERMLPFDHQQIEPFVHASNRLFYLVITNAKKTGLIGAKGVPSIRRTMPMSELLFNILTVAPPIPLIRSDLEYYAQPATAYAEKLNQPLSDAFLHQIEVPKIVWVRNDISNPTKLTCRIFTNDYQQDMFSVPVIINSDGFYDLDI